MLLEWLRRWREGKSKPAESQEKEEATEQSPGAAKAPPAAQRSLAETPLPRAGRNGEPPTAPLVIARADHNISRRDISVNALKVMGRLINHGHEAYLVGGCIRDLLIGRKPKDFDVVTDAKPDDVRALFRNCRLIGRRFRLAHVFFHGGEIIEVSTFRRGIPFDTESDGPVQDENTFGTPAQDAWRRDLTINGLFYDLKTFAIYDYVGGAADLRAKVIRAIGEPAVRFREDPIRMVRALRHAARTGFAIEPVTRAAIAECAGEIVKANPSRRRDELLRELNEGWSRPSLGAMVELGLLRHILPVAQAVLGEGETATPARERLLNNLAAVDEAIGRGREMPLELILAAFCAPFAASDEGSEQGDGGRRNRGLLHLRLRDQIKPLVTQLGFSRANAEGVVAMLAIALQIADAAKRPAPLPKGVTRKTHFALGLQLVQIEARGRKEWLPKPIFDAARERNLLLFASPGAPKARRRSRRRGGRGRKNPADGAVAPPGNGDAAPAPAAPVAETKDVAGLRFDLGGAMPE